LSDVGHDKKIYTIVMCKLLEKFPKNDELLRTALSRTFE